MPSTRTRRRQALACGAAITLTAPLLAVSATTASADPTMATYEVTIANSSVGQPFSPPVAATHSPDVELFSVGDDASPEIAAIAQTGNQSGAVALLSGLGSDVTAVADPGAPVTPGASSSALFPSTLTIEVEAAAGDVLSLATMLICSNDGFTGLDSVALPAAGSVVLPLRGYDAGVERNTERSQDIVDACSALGPVVIGDDPDGNVDDFPVAQRNAKPIQMHKGVNGHRGDLLPAHDWAGSVGTVTIERL